MKRSDKEVTRVRDDNDTGMDRGFFITSFVLLILFIVTAILQNLGVFTLTSIFSPCPIYVATGMYCPGCGGTHAVTELAAGHITASIISHPFVIYIIILSLICVSFFFLSNIISKIRNNAPKKRQTGRYLRFRLIYVYAAVAVIVIQCIIKNIR
ncbi:MAG: DUF2752 domain-containing protein [Eubacterium sp.]|nr:DUF2752 domain-containing protein [Eubacterium sp.]